MDRKTDYMERISRGLTLMTFAIAVLVAFGAPLAALSWSKQPFPGFMVEQTLVVNGISGSGWIGKAAGIDYPQQVLRVAGVQVESPAEFDAVLRSHAIGDTIAVITRLPNGSLHVYPAIELTPFPGVTLVRYFWAMYLIGLVYLGIGIWVYLVRGKSRTGRVLAFFCATTAVGTMLIFDLSSTHLGIELWTMALAFAAGSLLSLGMRFPVEWPVVQRYPWALALPYIVSASLAVWGSLVVRSPEAPWAYITNWEVIYRFAALCILAFLGLAVYLSVSNQSFEVRQQSRTVLLGSAIAFIPVAFMFLASRRIGFHVFLLAFLPAFPVSVAVAVMRYNLWKVDTFINRTLLVGVLTTLLAGLYTALKELLEIIFFTSTGETNNAAVIITAFIVAATIRPVQRGLDQFISQRFGPTTDTTRKIRSFGDQIRTHLFFSSPDEILCRLLEETSTSLQAESCVVMATRQGKYEISHLYGAWRANAVASIPLQSEGHHFGTLFIGPRTTGAPYHPEEFAALQEVADQAARAIRFYVDTHVRPPHPEPSLAPTRSPLSTAGSNEEISH